MLESTPMATITIPDIVPYLLAILGLLMVWQLHDIQVRAGRIKAVDIWSQSGIRLFLHITPDDPHACPTCRTASGTALLPAVVAAKKFKPTAKSCTNPAGCRCLLIGLYGGWPEAERLRAELGNNGGQVRLSPERLERLLDGAQARRSGVAADQISIALLEAIRAERSDPDRAIDRYRLVVSQAQKERDRAFVTSSYLRLIDLLEQRGQYADALSTVNQFLKVSNAGSRTKYGPTDAQLDLMSLRRTRLTAAIRNQS
jgi:hypothetical protein